MICSDTEGGTSQTKKSTELLNRVGTMAEAHWLHPLLLSCNRYRNNALFAGKMLRVWVTQGCQCCPEMSA